MLFKTIVPPCERLSAILSGGEGKHTRRQYRNAVWALDFECSNPLEVSRCENAKGKRYSKKKRGARNWAPLGLKAPQCGAFQGFAGFRAPGFGRKLRCTLSSNFAVMGERQGRQMPMATDFPRWSFRKRLRNSLFSTTQKSDFCAMAILVAKCVYFAPLKSIKRLAGSARIAFP